ncbi:MAG TPA: hypothetical protein VFI31_00130 [Pirellulales bacterium]|nr:hypothetical protein [Pirellulales bacterium]
MSPLQFRLRSLFIATAGVALLLTVWRLFGSRTGLVLLLSIEIILPFVWRPRWLYAWFLPLLWTTIAWQNFYHPGDEYGGFFVGSLAGLWVGAFSINAGSVRQAAILVVAAGATSVATAGWILDKLRAPLAAWFCLFLVTAAGLFARSFGAFPSVERALAKNGSYEAYVLPSLNLGLTLATLAVLLATAVYRLSSSIVNRWRARRRFRQENLALNPSSEKVTG